MFVNFYLSWMSLISMNIATCGLQIFKIAHEFYVSWWHYGVTKRICNVRKGS